MEQEDESTAYLKFLTEGPQSYLLQSTEDGLTDTLPVESIFTEINSDWSVGGFPILLSGSLVSEENSKEINNDEDPIEFYKEDTEDSAYDDSSSRTVTFYANVGENDVVASNNIIFPKDVLLQLENTQNGDDDDDDNSQLEKLHLINGNTYSITYTPETDTNDEEEESKNENIQIIELINIDGSVTTINKDILKNTTTIIYDNDNQSNNINIDDFYCEIQAQKCKICSFLCETVDEIVAHVKSQHEQELSSTAENITIVNDDVDKSILKGAKMTSILNVNNQKKILTYLCSECGDGYSNKELLKNHMITQHKLIIAKNNPEDKTGSNQQNEKTDRLKLANIEKVKDSVRAISESLLKRQRREKKIKCSIKGCPFRFARDDSRIRHEECHVNQERSKFQCPKCKEKFSIWRICSSHLWKCHQIDVGLFTCPMCNDFKSNSAGRVINHMAIHHEEKPFICSFCGKGYKQIAQLKNHEFIHQSPDKIPSCFTVKQCEFCERYFANEKILKKHIKDVHHKLKPFICNICGHQTSRKAMLELHYRQHTGDKPHACSYCDFKSRDPNCLRKHIMRHCGSGKYSCPYCPFKSIQTTNYKAHLANKHPGKEGTHACTECSYTTVNVAAFLSHVKCHELEKRNKQNAEKNDKTEVKNNTPNDKNNKSNPTKEFINPVEDDETQNCFINGEQCEETVDTGGITIPAGFDLPLVS